MSLSGSRTTDLRGAAVAAALAGAVIVVVGYATGLGLATPPTPGAPTGERSRTSQTRQTTQTRPETNVEARP
jgi:hypothetical protein